MAAGSLPRRRSLTGPGIALIAIGFFVFMFGTLMAAVTGFVHPIIPPLIGFALMAGGGMMIAFTDTAGSSEVPTVKLRQDGAVVRLICPACGGSLGDPSSAHGVVRCEYCRTRILVP